MRRAGYAFLEMRRRIERAVEQRTTMLNGVSHDLRTVLTRFKLSLELFDDGPDAEAMHRDIDEMGRMLEAYLAFARGRRRRDIGPDRHARACSRSCGRTPSGTGGPSRSRSRARRA